MVVDCLAHRLAALWLHDGDDGDEEEGADNDYDNDGGGEDDEDADEDENEDHHDGDCEGDDDDRGSFSSLQEPSFLQLNAADSLLVHIAPPNHDPSPGRAPPNAIACIRKMSPQERKDPGQTGQDCLPFILMQHTL